MALGLNLRKKRALIAVAIAIPILIAGLGVPAVISKSRDPIPGVDDVERGPSAALQQVAGTSAADEAVLVAEEAEAIAAAEAAVAVGTDDSASGPAPSADGDLAVALDVGLARAGSTINASVTLSNLSLEEFYVPAQDEPQPTLAVVVVDSAGEETRRIVEASHEDFPRKMRLLQPGDRLEVAVSIVAEGEEGLPVGSYRAYAEFGSDPTWSLIGLPCYAAGDVPPRSEWFAFDVE